MKRFIRFVGSALLIAATVLLVWQRVTRNDTPSVRSVPKAAAEVPKIPARRSGMDAAVRVSTWQVRATSLAETVIATGSLRAEESVELQVEVSGKVVAINFREGTRVRKGELLLKINDAELVATRARTRARLNLAKLKEARFSKLAAVGGINEQEYDTARSELAVQQSELELIEAQIDKTELHAPFDGIIGLRFISEGAYITATSNNAVRIATLQSIDNLKIDFALPEKYAGRIKVGARIRFTLTGYEPAFDGEVFAFEPRVDVNTRTILVRALCPNEGTALVPGAFATVQLRLDELENAIVVPASAVIPGLSEKNVFVVEQGKAVRRSVQTGARTESAVHILSGLKVGDVLVTSGLQQLRSGQSVEAMSAPEARVNPGEPSQASALSSVSDSPVRSVMVQ